MPKPRFSDADLAAMERVLNALVTATTHLPADADYMIGDVPMDYYDRAAAEHALSVLRAKSDYRRDRCCR